MACWVHPVAFNVFRHGSYHDMSDSVLYLFTLGSVIVEIQAGVGTIAT
jgi:hypothetical protein